MQIVYPPHVFVEKQGKYQYFCFEIKAFFYLELCIYGYLFD